MNDEQQLAYLANVLAIAHGDGVVSAGEEELLEQVRTGIHAKKSSLNAARKSASGFSPSLKPLERLSDRIRCLEDMVAMAYADGNLAKEEKALLASLGRESGLSQEQFDEIVRQVRKSTSTAGSSCGKCGTELPAEAKFCPSCGAEKKSAAAPVKSVALAVPDQGVFISFAHSTAGSFSRALSIARSMPSFQEVSRDGKKWYGCAFNLGEIAAALELVDAIGSVRNKEVFLDGAEAEWRDVFRFAPCALEREDAYDKVQYCFGVDEGRFNIFGCKQMGMSWSHWDDLFTYGHFKRKDVFVFDKKKVSHEILQRTATLQICPHFRLKFIQAISHVFPEWVMVGERHPWAYREVYQPDPRAITIKTNRHGFREEIRVIGVSPVDASSAKTILKDALQLVAQPDLTLPRLGIK